ncbi:hypothetical protein ACFLZZ_00240 [Nanoarchaeota archaeon]
MCTYEIEEFMKKYNPLRRNYDVHDFDKKKLKELTDKYLGKPEGKEDKPNGRI